MSIAEASTSTQFRGQCHGIGEQDAEHCESSHFRGLCCENDLTHDFTTASTHLHGLCHGDERCGHSYGSCHESDYVRAASAIAAQTRGQGHEFEQYVDSSVLSNPWIAPTLNDKAPWESAAHDMYLNRPASEDTFSSVQFDG